MFSSGTKPAGIAPLPFAKTSFTSSSESAVPTNAGKAPCPS